MFCFNSLDAFYSLIRHWKLLPLAVTASSSVVASENDATKLPRYWEAIKKLLTSVALVGLDHLRMGSIFVDQSSTHLYQSYAPVTPGLLSKLNFLCLLAIGFPLVSSSCRFLLLNLTTSSYSKKMML
jgi:hypothetical protein